MWKAIAHPADGIRDPRPQSPLIPWPAVDLAILGTRRLAGVPDLPTVSTGTSFQSCKRMALLLLSFNCKTAHWASRAVTSLLQITARWLRNLLLQMEQLEQHGKYIAASDSADISERTDAVHGIGRAGHGTVLRAIWRIQIVHAYEKILIIRPCGLARTFVWLNNFNYHTVRKVPSNWIVIDDDDTTEEIRGKIFRLLQITNNYIVYKI